MTQYLLRIEGVNLSHFIFDTNNISTARGGSLLLLRAATTVIAEVRRSLASSGVTIEPISGGASLCLASVTVPNDVHLDSARIRSCAEQVIAEDPALRHATLTVVVTPLAQPGHFVRAREEATAVARWRQMQSPSISLEGIADDGAGACTYDKARPSTKTIQRGSVANGEEIPVSAATKARFEFGREQRQSFYVDELGLGETASVKTTDDLHELSSAPPRGEDRLDGKMAVLYLDGNAFGALHRAVRDGGEQRALDACLQGNHKAFLSGAIAHMQTSERWRTRKDSLRIETLIWGGDDLAFVVPAWCGWQFAQQFFTMARRWSFGQSPLSYAGGMVFCHAEASIHRIRALANRLCDEMAKPIAKRGGPSHHALAMATLESFDDIPGDLAGMFGTRFSLSPSAVEQLVLSGPDLGDQMGRLAKARAELNTKLPRRQLVRAANAGPAITVAAERREAVEKLNAACKEAGIEQSLKDALKCLAGKGAAKGDIEFVPWIQLADWWDYMSTSPAETAWSPAHAGGVRS